VLPPHLVHRDLEESADTYMLPKLPKMATHLGNGADVGELVVPPVPLSVLRSLRLCDNADIRELVVPPVPLGVDGCLGDAKSGGECVHCKDWSCGWVIEVED
jgi:hypothetical protein